MDVVQWLKLCQLLVDRQSPRGTLTLPSVGWDGNEICDRFAAAGFNANMVSYLTQELHMPLVESTNTLNNFSGTSSLTPIIGALLADSFAGCFWTITPSSTSWYGYRPEN